MTGLDLWSWHAAGMGQLLVCAPSLRLLTSEDSLVCAVCMFRKWMSMSKGSHKVSADAVCEVQGYGTAHLCSNSNSLSNVSYEKKINMQFWLACCAPMQAVSVPTPFQQTRSTGSFRALTTFPLRLIFLDSLATPLVLFTSKSKRK